MPGQPLREVLSRFSLEYDRSSFNRADRAIGSLRSKLLTLGRLALGGGGVLAFKKMTDSVINMGDQLDKTASKLGISTNALQEFNYAANQSDIPLRSFQMGLQRMARRAAEAATGQGEAVKALSELGVQLHNTDGSLRSTEDLFMDVAGAMEGVEDPNRRLRLAFKLFDSEGVALVNVLKEGRGGLEAMRMEARELGGVMDKELIGLTVQYKSETTRVQQALQGVRNTIVKNLLPGMLQTLRNMRLWIVRNREWLATGIVKAAESFGKAVRRAAQFAGFLVLSIKGILAQLNPLQRQFVLIASIAGLLALLFGVWPTVLGAALLIIEDIVGFFEGKQSVTGDIVEWLTELFGLLATAPFQEGDPWYVKVMQAWARAIQWVIDTIDGLLKALSGPVGDLLYGRGGVTLEKLAKLPFRLLSAAGVALPGGRQAAEAEQQIVGFARRTGRQVLGLGGAGGGGGTVSIQQTINPPAGTSSAEVGEQAGRKAARAVQAEQNRAALRAFAPQAAPAG